MDRSPQEVQTPMKNDGSIPKWLIFDGESGEFLNGTASAFGAFRILNDEWGRGWTAYDVDDPEKEVRIAKGVNVPFQAVAPADSESLVRSVIVTSREDPYLRVTMVTTRSISVDRPVHP